MIISAKEIYDNIDIQNIRENILAIGGGELEIWKKTVIEKTFYPNTMSVSDF